MVLRIPNQLELGAGYETLLAHRLLKTEPRAKANPHTLSIDIGGTGIKMIVLDETGKPVNERTRTLAPHPATPAAVMAIITEMVAQQPAFDRVSVGFPGVVKSGVVMTAPNLGSDFWHEYPLAQSVRELVKCPVHAINDANLQGYGVITGKGVEIVITLGTGFGFALFSDGHLVPNVELGHHPWKKEQTYEDRLRDSELKEIGKKRWSKRVFEALELLSFIFNYDVVYLGGGNVEHLKGEFAANMKTFTNVEGMTGGVKVWSADLPLVAEQSA